MTREHVPTPWIAEHERLSWAGRFADRLFRGMCMDASGHAVILVTRFCVVLFAVVAVSGCGKFQEELNTAKAQIEALDVQTKDLSDRLSRLDGEKMRLSQEMKLLAEKNEVLRGQLTALEKAKSALEKELDAAKQQNEEAVTQLEALKRQKADLDNELEALKKRASAPPALPSLPQEHADEGTAVPAPEKTASGSKDSMTPCDVILHYMRQSQAIVRNFKGDECSKRLEQLKQQLGPRMSGAPEKALKAADAWISEIVRVWGDTPREDSAFILLSNKGTVLDACNKTPEEAGF